MESLVSLNCAEAVRCESPLPTASIWQDILAQAVTGELMAAMNYRSLSTICDDPEEVAEALEHAEGEQGHAAAFAAEGRKIGVDVPSNVNARYWKRIRESFMRLIAERDFMACLIVQEIMLDAGQTMFTARLPFELHSARKYIISGQLFLDAGPIDLPPREDTSEIALITISAAHA